VVGAVATNNLVLVTVVAVVVLGTEAIQELHLQAVKVLLVEIHTIQILITSVAAVVAARALLVEMLVLQALVRLVLVVLVEQLLFLVHLLLTQVVEVEPLRLILEE
jgi:hypothetical protein